jgi:hypothetical protein
MNILSIFWFLGLHRMQLCVRIFWFLGLHRMQLCVRIFWFLGLHRMQLCVRIFWFLGLHRMETSPSRKLLVMYLLIIFFSALRFFEFYGILNTLVFVSFVILG